MWRHAQQHVQKSIHQVEWEGERVRCTWTASTRRLTAPASTTTWASWGVWRAILSRAPAATSLTEGSNSSRHIIKGGMAPESTTAWARGAECLAMALNTPAAAFLLYLFCSLHAQANNISLPPSRIIHTHAQLLSEKKYSEGKLKKNSSTSDFRLRLETKVQWRNGDSFLVSLDPFTYNSKDDKRSNCLTKPNFIKPTSTFLSFLNIWTCLRLNDTTLNPKRVWRFGGASS